MRAGAGGSLAVTAATTDTSLPTALIGLSGIRIDAGGADGACGACGCATKNSLGLKSFVAESLVLTVVAGTGVGSAFSTDDETVVSLA